MRDGGLTDELVEELARLYPNRIRACQLLERAGLAVERQPSGGLSSSLEFWREVARCYRAGAVVDGPARLIAAAVREWPASVLLRVASANGGLSSEPEAIRVAGGRQMLGRPAFPSRFVGRDRELGIVRDRLTGGFDSVVGLVGMGGQGKSTLARAAVHDRLVVEAFPDGIAWVQVEQGWSAVAVLSAVLEALEDAAPAADEADAKRRLRRLFQGRRLLVVLDNLWDRDVMRALPLIDGIRVLVTTRDARVLFTGDTPVNVGDLDHESARCVLADYAGWPAGDLPGEALPIVTACAGLPLALALAGGLVAEHWGWDEVAEAFAGARHRLLTGRLPHYEYENLHLALDASISRLAPDEAERFRELAPFKGFGPIPEEVIVSLWQPGGMPLARARELLRRFSGMSLVQIRRDRTVTMHDLLFDHAAATLVPGRLSELHSLVATDVLNRWGGLPAGLPQLPKAMEASQFDRYGLAAVVSHLAAGSRGDLLAGLLMAECVEETGTSQNLWYVLHRDAGELGGYVADIRMIWRFADDRTGGIGWDRDAVVVACALILGSITNIAGTVPPALLARAVAEGLWSPARALTVAHATPDPCERVFAFAALLPHLSGEQRRETLAAALAAIPAIEEPINRPPALLALLRRLPPEERADVTARAIAAITALGASYAQVVAFADLLTYLADDQHGEVLGRALRSTAAIDDEASRLWAAAPLLPYLTGERRDRLAEEMFTRAVTLDNPADRLRALTGILPYISASRRANGLALAVDANAAATRRPFLYRPTRDLTRLASRLPNEERPAVISAALTIATAQTDSADRAAAIADLLPHVPPTTRAELTAAAIAATRRVKQPDERAHALTSLLPHLSDQELDEARTEAFELVMDIGPPFERAASLAALVPHLTMHELTEVLDADAALDEPDIRVYALIRLLPYLPDSVRPAFLRRAVAAADAVLQPHMRITTLIELLDVVPEEQRDAAIDKALDTAYTVRFPYEKATALRQLAGYLTGRDRASVINDALRAARTNPAPTDRARTLTALVPLLPIRRLAPVLDEAHEAASQEEHPHRRASALVGILPYLPRARSATVRDEILEIARDLPPHEQARTLVTLAKHLPTAQRNTTIEEALYITSRLAPHEHAEILIGLIHLLSEDRRGPLIKQALDATHHIDDPRKRIQHIENLEPYTSPDVTSLLLTETLDILTTSETSDSLAYQLTSIAVTAAKIGSPDAKSYWRTALAVASRVSRTAVLELLPLALDNAPEKTQTKIVEAVIKVHNWWP